MKEEGKILERLHELRTVIEELRARANKELEKKRPETDLFLLRFLSQECSVYEFALSNLEWVLDKNDQDTCSAFSPIREHMQMQPER